MIKFDRLQDLPILKALNETVYNNFRELIDTCKHNDKIYIRAYKQFNLIEELSYNQYYEKVLLVASHLNDKLVGTNCKVLVCLDKSVDMIIAYSALLYIGATVIPIGKDEGIYYITQVIEKFNVDSLVIDDEKMYSHINKNKYQLADLQTQNIDYCNNEFKKISLETDSAIFLTSGTTGIPKGANHTHESLLYNGIGVKIEHGMDENHVHMTVLPLYHVNGFNFSFIGTLLNKSKLILTSGFFQPAFFDIIENEKVNVVSIVPIIASYLNKDPREIKKEKLKSLKYLVSAASSISVDTVAAFYNKYNLRINQAYGLSEAVNFSLLIPTKLSQKSWENLMRHSPIPAGRSFWGNQVEIYKDNTIVSTELLEGELIIRGTNVMKAYLFDNEANKSAIRNEWLHTGDIGYFKIIDETKYFFITGRMKNFIKKKGEMISIDDVENQIIKILKNENLTVVGFKKDNGSEELGLYLCHNEISTSIDEISKLLNDKLTEKKCPSLVIINSEPARNVTGKSRRQYLKKYFENN